MMHQQQHSLRGVNTHHNPPLTPKGKLVATCSVSRSPLASSSPLSFSKKKRSSIAVSAALSAAAAAAAVSGTSSSGVGCRASPSKHFSLEKLFSGSGAQHPSHTTTTTSTTTTSSPNLKNSTYPYSSSSPTKKEASKQLALVGSVVVATPTKLSKGKATVYDRFIPNRKAMDLATAQFNLAASVSAPSSSSSSTAASYNHNNTSYLDSSAIAYQEEIAKACGLALDKRILAFKPDAPVSDFSRSDQLRANWNRPLRPPNSKLAKRKISTVPDRVLDAPGMSDDYYLNLLDWSAQNVLAVGLDKNVYLWNAETGSVQDFYQTDENDYIASLQWTHDGSYLAIGTLKGDTQIWDVSSNSKIRSMKGHVSRVGVLSWDKHILSSGARDGSIWNHDVRIANHKVGELLGHESEVCGLKWRPDGQMLASGGNDNMVNIWDARSSVPKFSKTEHTAAVKAMAWCPWQLSLLASGGGSQDRHIHFWNSTTGSKLSSIDTGSQVTSIVWSREYKELLSSHGFPNNHLTVWGYPSLKKISEMAAHDARVLHTSLSPDGQTVATCAADENLKFWKVFENRKRPGVAAGKEGGSLDSDRPDEDDKNNNDDDDQGYSGGDKKTASRRKDSKYSSIESTLAQTMRSMSIR